METNIDAIKKDIISIVVGFVVYNREQLIQIIKDMEDDEEELEIVALIERMTDYELASLVANRIDNELASEDPEDYIIAQRLLEVALPWVKTINMDYLRSIQYSLEMGETIADKINE